MIVSSDAIRASDVAGICVRSLADRRVIAARRAIEEGDHDRARAMLDALIAEDAGDPITLNLYAELDLRDQRFDQAAAWFDRCLAAAPGFLAALHGKAYCHFQAGRLAAAQRLADRMLAFDPTNTPARLLKAAVASLVGDDEVAVLLYRGLLAERPGHYPSLLSLGHGLRTLGDTSGAIAAYREALRCNRLSAEGWSSLASLKVHRFSESELAAMLELDRRRDLPDSERRHLHFALGRAFWQRDEDAASFEHYARANALARADASEDLADLFNRNNRWVDRSIAAWPGPAGATKHPAGAAVPIFVVGLPRSGTTLVEQILGSHPAVEATSELPCLHKIARRLMNERGELSRIDREALAAEYLEASAVYRKTDRPFFVDKLPINYLHVALIRAILPKARIVEVRRHPLANCVGMFRQHFFNLPEYGGSLAQIAAARRDYEAAMGRFDAAWPGAVIRIDYETLVEDTESEIWRLLEAVGLPFEDACLSWYANGQPVRTPSSEQVRQPIYREALEEWRRFEPWLGEARAVLGL